jgi:hypothetical protein
MQEEELSRVEEDTTCVEEVDRDKLDKGRAAAAARPDAGAWRCKRVPSRTFFRPLPVVAGALNSPLNQDKAGVQDVARVYGTYNVSKRFWRCVGTFCLL